MDSRVTGSYPEVAPAGSPAPANTGQTGLPTRWGQINRLIVDWTDRWAIRGPMERKPTYRAQSPGSAAGAPSRTRVWTIFTPTRGLPASGGASACPNRAGIAPTEISRRTLNTRCGIARVGKRDSLATATRTNPTSPPIRSLANFAISPLPSPAHRSKRTYLGESKNRTKPRKLQERPEVAPALVAKRLPILARLGCQRDRE